MKMHYLRFGVLYCVLTLIIFASVISIYTKKKIDTFNQATGYSVLNSMHRIHAETHDLRDIVRNTIFSWELTGYRNDLEGYYSSIIDTRNNNEVILNSQDFIKVRYYGEIENEVITDTPDSVEIHQNQLAPGDDRYMFFTEPLDITDDDEVSLRIANTAIISGAKCDDIFVCGGSLSFETNGETKTLEIARPTLFSEEGSVPYEDWIVRLDALEVYAMDGSASKRRLNQEAQKLSGRYIEDFLNGNIPGTLKVRNGIFTSTASTVIVCADGNYLVTLYSVTKPLETVLKSNLKIYIPALLAFLIVEAVIIFATRKLYLDQKAFEIRSRKLTQGIAHDLKEPLAATRTQIENWENLSGEERARYSEKIISEVDHMSGMVTRLLELSKTGGNNIKLNKEDVDLLLLTRNIESRKKDLLKEKNIDISIIPDGDDNSYTVNADLEMIDVVIGSFMSNAIKYCDHIIKIDLIRNGSTVTFKINNDGAKIEDSNIDEIWDDHYVLKAGSSDQDESSGISLAVIGNILKAHHAKYGCYSGSKGTVFWFSMYASSKENPS